MEAACTGDTSHVSQKLAGQRGVQTESLTQQTCGFERDNFNKPPPLSFHQVAWRNQEHAHGDCAVRLLIGTAASVRVTLLNGTVRGGNGKQSQLSQVSLWREQSALWSGSLILLRLLVGLGVPLSLEQ